MADTGQRRATRHEGFVELTLRDGRLVAGSRKWSAGRYEPYGIPESHVAAHQVAEAHGEQARSDEQYDCQGHLGGDQATPETSISPGEGRASIARAPPAPRHVRDKQGRTQAESNRQQHRQTYNHPDHSAIEPGIRQVGHADSDAIRNRREQTACRHLTDGHGQRGADEAGHEAFDEELAQDTPARGAQGGSHGQLRRARDVPSQHEQREIRTHDHEQESHGAEQARDDRLHVTEQCVAQRQGDDGAAGESIGGLARERRRHGGELGSGARQWRVVLKPADNVDRAIEPVGAPLLVGDEGHEHVRILEQGEVKRRRQHAHDCMGRSIDRDGLAERAYAGHGTGKVIGDNGDCGAGRRILVAQKIATGRYPDAEEPEEAGGDFGAAQHTRLVTHSDREVAGVVALEVAEAVGTGTPVEQRGIRRRTPLVAAPA